MSEVDKNTPAVTEEPVTTNDSSPQPSDAAMSAEGQRVTRTESRRWWIKLFVQPTLLLASGAILIVGLGVAQRAGFISAGGGGHSHTSGGDSSTRYICPMMCTPPQAEPGHFRRWQIRLTFDSRRSGNEAGGKHPHRGGGLDADLAHDSCDR